MLAELLSLAEIRDIIVSERMKVYEASFNCDLNNAPDYNDKRLKLIKQHTSTHYKNWKNNVIIPSPIETLLPLCIEIIL